MLEHHPIQRKLEAARQELLDLGLRNPLLNYRTLKARGLEIVQEKPTEVFRILVSQKRKMTFLEVNSAKEQPQSELVVSDHQDDVLFPIDHEQVELEVSGQPEETSEPLEHEIDSKLQTPYVEKQLEQRLLNTYYYARTYIEEQGVNILYMALGMLHWKEAGHSQELRKAPLLLVPVQLDRVSARHRFTLSYTEDEIGHNISLSAKMKADFGVDIPALPEDGDPDIVSYFQEVKRAIEGQKGWMVDTNSIVIGFFSFGKFLMYRDLDTALWPEHARPENHPVITALLEDGFQEESSTIPEDDSLDKHIRLADSNHILDADSSQLMAILDAAQGRNMVIQGPPGTGKSQTITNLIAESIGAGKKVLFVSEKMAALEVVKRRLDAAGLGVACLELHSHKTNKKTLLSELKSTLDLGKPGDPGDGDIALLEDLRNRLNEYGEALNSPVGQTGVTPYTALGELVRFASHQSQVTLPKVSASLMESWTAEQFKKREALLEELQNLIRSIGSPAKHPFWGSLKKVVLPADVDELRQAASAAREKAQALISLLQNDAAELQVPMPTHMSGALAFVTMLDKTAAAPEIQHVSLHSPLWKSDAERIMKWIEAGEAYASLRKKYDSILLPEAWEQELLDIRQTIAAYSDKWWRFLSGSYRKAKSRLLGLCKDPKQKTATLIEIVDTVMEARRLKETIMSHEQLGITLFSSQWRGMDSDWRQLSAVCAWTVKLHEEIQDGQLPEWTLDVLSGNKDKAELVKMKSELATATREVHRTASRVTELAEFSTERRFGSDAELDEQELSVLIDLWTDWSERAEALQEMASYNQLIQVCEQEQLQPFTALAEHWDDAEERLVDAFKWNGYQIIVTKAFIERPALAQFDSSRHEHAVQKFRELDQSLALLNRVKLALHHWNKLPSYEAGGQLGVLLREFEKKTRHLPIRQLMLKAGNAIQAIKPIFMMGPLSISTYLQPGSLEFDLVIFDEASQVKPVDAFGAIIRAKQAIVVGDSKQMPPTNFFDSISKEDEGEEDLFVADMESILGLFVGQNAPQRMLRWHYRSRHESLIMVSNHEFYENKLVVFPSPDADKHHSGLIYNYLPHTYYDRGRTRTNPLEAKTVAEAVMEHAKSRPHLTLGVAAFSKVQMEAIQNELEILRRADPSCESFFTSHLHEPFFVKNLENVQGDERDVILISIGYGKTSEGYLAMDFGPLNREGGERRLNVLITRARLRCEVFTNLSSDDIDLNRSNARGVKALKTFLKYADSGQLDIPVATGKDFDSPFEQAVSESLMKLGYEVKSQVGSGGFFIDLAVVDPQSPGRFLLGIECDGAAYHSSRSARDRDRLRQEVLEGLGWRIHRVWSTDWFRHPERELKRVVAAIEEAKMDCTAEDSESLDTNLPHVAYEIERDDSVSKESETGAEPYRAAELHIDLKGKDFHTMPLPLVSSWVLQVVEAESPVHVNEVMKRITDAAGLKRLGSRIQEHLEQAIENAGEVERRGEFLWLKGMQTATVRNRSALTNKKVDYIAKEEMEAAIEKVVRECFGADEDTVIHSVVQTLGFARVTDDIRAYVKPIIEYMIENQALLLKNNMLIAAPNLDEENEA
ncbi:DUF3320 domain-containing protein [Marinicrinis lubricantis]|uniref:DUF3320 domain-containing protein n=1 Tax=Marinicrinis lubricantis TaxID=2086470 RepID=A0ABW1INP6_9BACL